MHLASAFFGAFLGIFPFTLVEICRQTRAILRRSRRRLWSPQNDYLYMIWAEALVSLTLAILAILRLSGGAGAGCDTAAFYAATAVLWTLQTQLLAQIMANRLSIIAMVGRRRARWMRLLLAGVILAVNVAVCVIWTPAQLRRVSADRDGGERLNRVFERVEKTFFLVVHFGLNLAFLYLIRFRLIAGGLPKYWGLFRVNVPLIVLSSVMDAALLGMLDLSEPYVYVQFSPLAYIVKLYIELVMATILAKTVAPDHPPPPPPPPSSGAIAAQDGSKNSNPVTYQPPIPMGGNRYSDKYGSSNSIFGGASVLTTAADDLEGRHEAPGDEAFCLSSSSPPLPSIPEPMPMPPVPGSSMGRISIVAADVAPEGNGRGDSREERRRRLDPNICSDCGRHLVPCPPMPPSTPAKDGYSLAMMKRSKSGRKPLTSRFSKR